MYRNVTSYTCVAEIETTLNPYPSEEKNNLTIVITDPLNHDSHEKYA